MLRVKSEDEGQIKKYFFTFPVGNLVQIPILIRIAFIPLEAFAVSNYSFHWRCILQQYTSFVKS